ncbi:MAG TPA: tetratricopeptide repeat protein [Phycisphaerae bacterium]|nr:tetratricopeptide repeat protein [Phycisphaerae bacterium]
MPVLASVLVTALAFAQMPQEPTIQQLYEAGQYAPLLERVAADEAPAPEDIYLSGQASRRLDPPDKVQARNWFVRLGGEETDYWTFIGRSANAMLGGVSADPDATPAEPDPAQAVADARHAVELAPEAFFAQYHLGFTLAETKDYAGAVVAFDKAMKLNPTFAYAYYYAGYSQYQLKRVDRMANHFERFLKLAPDAPERPAIQALMRSIRR